MDVRLDVEKCCCRVDVSVDILMSSSVSVLEACFLSLLDGRSLVELASSAFVLS